MVDVATERRRLGGSSGPKRAHDRFRLRILDQVVLIASTDPVNCREELEMGL